MFVEKIIKQKFRRILIILNMIFFTIAVPATVLAENNYSSKEVVQAGEDFFSSSSKALARVIEKAFAKHGYPNGYILGQEGSGSFVLGATYGEGILYTKNAGDHPVFWQGPSLGFDFGVQGSKVMMLVYYLDKIKNIYSYYSGVSGSAYVVAGFGFNVLKNDRVVLVPIRTGIGLRLGINLGYLKLTSSPTWNPF